jgi:hypothetical protein
MVLSKCDSLVIRIRRGASSMNKRSLQDKVSLASIHNMNGTAPVLNEAVKQGFIQRYAWNMMIDCKGAISAACFKGFE